MIYPVSSMILITSSFC